MRLLLILALLLVVLPAQAQDTSLDPTYEAIELEEGFMPDPITVDLTAGGDVMVDIGDCAYGYVAEAPDVDLYYSTSESSDLSIYAVSSADTMLLINLPDGTWVCDDDSYDDGDPIVTILDAPAGVYNIWVGTFGEEPDDATLFISEIDPR